MKRVPVGCDAWVRRAMSALVFVTLVACADGEKNAPAASLRRDVSPRSMLRDDSLSRNTDFRAVDYPVTADRYQSWSRAQRGLDALPVPTSSDQLPVRGSSDLDVDRLVARLEADPAARRAIEQSGLSVRDYVFTTLALAQAMDATEGGGRARLVGVPSENVAIYSRYRDDYRRFRHGARYRVIHDDEDDDDDSDRRGRARRRGGDDDSHD